MSRTMPTECEHGEIIDWGDFGPCQNCDEHPGDECPNFRDCSQCQPPTLRNLGPIERSVAEIEALRAVLAELYEPNHRKRHGADLCDVCGRRWPCAHFEAALLIHGDGTAR